MLQCTKSDFLDQPPPNPPITQAKDALSGRAPTRAQPQTVKAATH
jgi:hypothetical protein